MKNIHIKNSIWAFTEKVKDFHIQICYDRLRLNAEFYAKQDFYSKKSKALKEWSDRIDNKKEKMLIEYGSYFLAKKVIDEKLEVATNKDVIEFLNDLKQAME